MAAEPEIAGRQATAGGPFPAERVSFERIEYGKLCTSPDGPILPGVEAYPLVRSRTFPPAVEKLCRPWIAGIGPEMLARSPHGTVLRGVRAGGRLSTLACRLRRRPESGEGGGGRRYWLGRYLCSPAAPADPLTCFRALAEPLRGITPAEARVPGRLLTLSPAGRPEVDETARRFLEQALVFAMSGLPVGVTALQEETFFLWAAALWHLLPAPLRPLLSVGWEVHPEQTRGLSLSTSTQFHPTVAVFDPREERWTHPERVIEEPEQDRGEPRTAPFTQAHLVPGLMYAREAFRWTGGRPVLASPDLEFLAGFDYGLGGSAPTAGEVVDLRSPWCRERLRHAGLRCLDHARLQQLEAWLRDGRTAEPEGLAISTAKYFFPDAKQRLLTVGLAAQAEPALRDKGDRILWASLLEDREIAERLPSGPRHARARLLRALAFRDLRGVFQNLIDGDPAALAELPTVVQEWLESALESSLETGLAALPYHQQILTGAEIPEPYSRWAILRAAGVAVLLGTSGVPETVPALERLDALSLHSLATVFVYLLSQESPGPDGVIWLRSLEARDLERCRKGLLHLWEQPEVERAAHRERLVPWLQATGPFETADPLLQILFQGLPSEPSASWLARLAREIVEGGVPSSLEPAVAAIALRWWRFFSPSYRAGLEPWRRIVRHWPDEHLLGLAGWLPPSRSVPTIPPPRQIELDGGGLEILIRSFVNTYAQQQKAPRDLLARAAALLWNACRDSHPAAAAGAESVQLCLDLLQHQVPNHQPVKEARQAVVTLSSLARDEDIPWADLWTATAHGWQMLFLLDCAPWVDFEPSVEQLSALILYRKHLQQHLKSKEIHPTRRARFLVASWNFQEAPYSNRREHWRDEFSETPLWAAFRHVPHSRQGSLATAVNAYSGGDGDDDLRTLDFRRVKLALAYLGPYEKLQSTNPNVAYAAARKVAEEIVAPLLRERHLEQEQLETLLRPPGRRTPTRRFFGRSPSLRLATRSTTTPVSVAGHEIVVAPWFHDLIEKLQDFDCVEHLIAEVNREPAA